MGGEIAAKVLASVKEKQIKQNGEIWKEEEKNKFSESIIKKFDEEGSPYYATSQLWDDGVIDPIDTRQVLGNCLDYSLNSERQEGKFGIFRM